LSGWLGGEDVPLRVVDRATPGVVAVGLSTTTGDELILR
jgi:hypothetical protein